MTNPKLPTLHSTAYWNDHANGPDLVTLLDERGVSYERAKVPGLLSTDGVSLITYHSPKINGPMTVLCASHYDGEMFSAHYWYFANLTHEDALKLDWVQIYDSVISNESTQSPEAEDSEHADRFDAWSNLFDVLHTPALPQHLIVRMHTTGNEYLLPSGATLPSDWESCRPYRGHYDLEPIPAYARRLYYR